MPMFQQTVEVARRMSDGARIAASDLLTMTESAFTSLRRLTTESLQRWRKEPSTSPFLVCECCGTALWLTRRSRGDGQGNRFFKHIAPAPCPWYSASEYTAEQILSMRFHGAKESAAHRDMKGFIAWTMGADPLTSGVSIDRVHYGKVLTGEWKRPDVRCTWKDISVVFEVQLSYTFISEVVKRDLFYRAENTFVIWVFKDSDEKYAFVKDEKYFNKQNLFILDAEARQESERRGRLVLSCHYTRPTLREDLSIVDQQECALVDLTELTFPPDSFRPFFHDYDLALAAAIKRKRELLAARAEARAVPTYSAPKPPPPAIPDLEPALHVQGLVGFRNALLSYGRRGLRDPADLWPVELAVDQIVDPGLQACAAHALKYPYLDALLRLLSVAIDTPLMTKYKTVYQVLDAALQASASTQRQFAFLYVEAWKEFHHPMKVHQATRLANIRETVRAKVVEGDLDYIPDRGFLRLVVAMFPSLVRQANFLTDAISARFALPPELNLQDCRWAPIDERDRTARGAAVRLYEHIVPQADWRDVLVRARQASETKKVTAEGILQIATAVAAPSEHVAVFLTRGRLVTTAQ